MKETFYFSHDYNARNDSKIKKLIFKHGLLGYGIYWALIEDLYNNNNALPMNYEMIAFDLRTEVKVIESIVNEFDLFVIDTAEWIFWSASVYERLEQRNEKSFKAKQSAYKRWNKNATALPTHNEGSAIKESKVKESKVKESKSIKPDLTDSNLVDGVSSTVSSKSSSKQAKTSRKDELLQMPYLNKEFKSVWDILIKEKKWQNKSFAALQASLNKLANYGEQGAIESMQDAISGGYQGVFAPKSFQTKNFLQTNVISKVQQSNNAFEEAKQILKNDSNNNHAD